MSKSRIEPLRPVLSRLVRMMKKDFPEAVPFDDRQDWPWEVSEAALPGTWAFTVGADTAGAAVGRFVPIPDIQGVSVRVIPFTGPPRAFLVGWSEERKSPVCVSTPLYREDVNASV